MARPAVILSDGIYLFPPHPSCHPHSLPDSFFAFSYTIPLSSFLQKVIMTPTPSTTYPNANPLSVAAVRPLVETMDALSLQGFCWFIAGRYGFPLFPFLLPAYQIWRILL